MADRHLHTARLDAECLSCRERDAELERLRSGALAGATATVRACVKAQDEAGRLDLENMQLQADNERLRGALAMADGLLADMPLTGVVMSVRSIVRHAIDAAPGTEKPG